MPPESHDDKELLRLVAAGDEDSFRALFEKYQDRVFKVAWKYLKSHALAQEVVQEVFIKLWYQRATLTGVEYFSTWLQTLSRNHIIDFMRKLDVRDAAHQQWAEGVGKEENTTDHKIRTAQYERLVEQALGELSDQQLAVYRLAKEQGLTYEQIAEALSLSPLTVKTHMQRALRSIRDFLKRHGEVYLLLLLMGR